MASVLNANAIATYENVIEAHERIRPHVHRTPVLTSQYMNDLIGAELFFKCENFQKTGAFKARGGCNSVFGLGNEDAKHGIATHSSGNHGQAIAYAAAMRGIEATVVMPNTAPQVKKDAVRGYGANVVECEPTADARDNVLSELVTKTGAEVIHPYNDARVIAGQGTCAKELIEDTEQLDTVITPVGGGGLISGSCLATKALLPAAEIIAAEPEEADDVYQSFKAGKIIIEPGYAPKTIADGLKAPVKNLTWHFISSYVGNVLIASEQEIINAMYLVWERMKIIIEPSCAVPIATLIANKDRFSGKRIGVILTGGNVDFKNLPK